MIQVSSINSVSFKGKVPFEFKSHKYSRAEIERIADNMVKSTPKDIVDHSVGYGMKQLYNTPEEILSHVVKKIREGNFDYLRGFFKAFSEELDKEEELQNINKYLDERLLIRTNTESRKPKFRERLKLAWKVIKGN